ATRLGGDRLRRVDVYLVNDQHGRLVGVVAPRANDTEHPARAERDRVAGAPVGYGGGKSRRERLGAGGARVGTWLMTVWRDTRNSWFLVASIRGPGGRCLSLARRKRGLCSSDCRRRWRAGMRTRFGGSRSTSRSESTPRG